MIGASRRILVLGIVLLTVFLSNAQDCRLPILSSFGDQTTESVELTWVDFNQGQTTWDLEYGLSGFDVTGIPTIKDLTQKSITVDNLDSGKTYEFYLRALCESGEHSGWNGPYFVNTAIDNDFSCGLNFELSDDNCPQQDIFLIEVSGYDDTQLGIDLVLERVDLVIKHSWPPDLRLKLISPQGEEIRLSTNNGTGIDDYGDASADNCDTPVRFTDNACELINLVEPPYVGQYRPEEPLSQLYSSESPNGLWQLSICDHASIDLGLLKYVKLEFSEMACIVPPSFSLSDIEADNVTFSWKDDFGCEALELVYKKQSAPVQSSFAEYTICGSESFTVLDLEPDTEYELIVRADCGSAIFSPESCVFLFRTACENSNLIENFDYQEICVLSCTEPCAINSLWQNSEQNNSDWILNTGLTPTRFTGPEGDLSKDGNYVYVENQASICPESFDIYLESSCLTKPSTSSCALSFSYHMFGQDIGSLSVEYSVDNSNWSELWQLSGSQANQWQAISIDLPISFERGRLRFKAVKLADAIRGDLALDNIKLIGIDTIAALFLYEDLDNDGYGNGERPLLICSEGVTQGYATNPDDCDDLRPSVFPGAPEIKCNQIDENCNGLDDDADEDQIAYVLGSIRSESCKGSADGFATIQGINGQEPYTYLWSEGSTGPGATDLTTGIYYCTISDVGGCQIVSDPIFIGFTDILVYSIGGIDNPSCYGDDNGRLELRIEGGIPPYTVEWNNGRGGSIINGLEDGKYFATISDGADCELVTDTITLQGPQVFTTGLLDNIPVDCSGNDSGVLWLGVLGGSPPYDILWSNGEREAIIDNIPEGEYAVTVTDQNGCLNVLEEIVVEEPDELGIFLVSIENISCFGETNSLVDINVKGGTPPYLYFWSDASNGQDLINRPAGNYSVTVSDFNSCSAVLEDVIIHQPDEIQISISQTQNVKCSGSQNGYIEVAVTGGTLPYAYNWGIRDGDETDENFLTDLSFGNYSLTVVDAFNCKSKAITIPVVNNSVPLDLVLEILSEVACYGDSTGMIAAQVGTALLPLDYNWSSGQNIMTVSAVDTLSNLLAGSYDLTVTDNEGCVGISSFADITQPDQIVYSLVSTSYNVCSYDSIGMIELSVAGGEMPYEVMWSNGEEGQALSALPNGSYTATITDARNCKSQVENIDIWSESELEMDINVDHPTGSSLGMISVVPKGGVAPYNYSWAPPIQFVTSNIADNLEVGSYSLSLTDINGCELDTLIELMLLDPTYEIIEERDFKISPNPTHGIITVNLESYNLSNCLFTIVDTKGKSLMQQKIAPSQKVVHLDISELIGGIYFVRIELEDKILVSKVSLIN